MLFPHLSPVPNLIQFAYFQAGLIEVKEGKRHWQAHCNLNPRHITLETVMKPETLKKTNCEMICLYLAIANCDARKLEIQSRALSSEFGTLSFRTDCFFLRQLRSKL